MHVTNYLVLGVFTGYGLALIVILIKLAIRQWRRRCFIKTVGDALSRDSQLTISDVRNIFGGVYDLDEEEDDSPSDMARLMKKVLISIYETGSADKQEQIAVLNKLIDECNKISPYYRLPKKERLIFTDLESHLSAHLTDDVRRKLYELVAQMLHEKEVCEKLKKNNRWSIPLAIIGNALTIIFGIMSLTR